MLGNFLIGLREGLEASLVISILVAYLVKTGRRRDVRYIWIGVATAITLVVLAFTIITIAVDQLPFRWQEGVGGSLSIIAAALVTWMIFWMRRTARGLKKELEGELESAVLLGAGAITLVAFLTVGREGLETAAILYATIANSYTATPFIGAFSGFVVAAVLGYLIYRGAVKVNLGKFFTVTGYLLIIVAAGVLAYGVHDLQEARFLPGLATKAFDVSDPAAATWNPQNPGGWMGTLLKGTINFQPDPTWLQAGVWVVYLAIVLTLYRRKPKAPAAPTPAPSESVNASS
ncbi:MAG: iron transporter [Aeromicrobium sp.]|uniref:iron uptake transporter permease EfeU n=1 Tax=Aeromicrobium sp. TaxID=1871063 RepID=UPI002639709D|nr:iron uptake transporter permease EfeU [Aeromicrobium sp.]MCW2825646.1 iron transporter [Aeromicrobium sp.]